MNLVLHHDLCLYLLSQQYTVVIILSFKNIRGSAALNAMAKFISIVLLATFVEGKNEMDWSRSL